jgi:hypothetical protein
VGADRLFIISLTKTGFASTFFSSNRTRENKSFVEVSRAYEYAMENGAAGITIFPDHSMSEEHWNYLSATMVKG